MTKWIVHMDRQQTVTEFFRVNADLNKNKIIFLKLISLVFFKNIS